MADGSSPKSGPHQRPRLMTPGEQFGRFMLVEHIGEGGMAEVFRAKTSWAEGVDKEVCIKRILPPLSSNERLREMFIQEARVAASLTHGNIVPVYEFGIIETYYFLAMEFVDGFTIRDIMMQAARQNRWLEVPEALYIATEVLEGLDYAHRKRGTDGGPLDIVHRDVTPGNVMVSREGEVKILDFGIAAIGGAQNTAQGAARGKPGYVAPEQAVGMAADGRADIYAVGVILYEMLTRRRLFKQKEPEARLQAASTVPRPSEARPVLPTNLDPVVLRALEPKAAFRYQKAGEFRDAIFDYMHENGMRMTRAQMARGLKRVFGSYTSDGPIDTDIRALDEGQLERPPRRQRVTRSTRTISSNKGAQGLDAAIASARRARLRGVAIGFALMALVGGIVALLLMR